MQKFTKEKVKVLWYTAKVYFDASKSRYVSFPFKIFSNLSHPGLWTNQILAANFWNFSGMKWDKCKYASRSIFQSRTIDTGLQNPILVKLYFQQPLKAKLMPFFLHPLSLLPSLLCSVHQCPSHHVVMQSQPVDGRPADTLFHRSDPHCHLPH